MKLRSLPGGVPEPEELVGRDHLIDVLWSQLAGNNIMLVAPRRFGKTGVMRHVLKRPREGYLPVYLDAEEIADPADFVAALLALVLEHSTLRKLLAAVTRLPKQLMDFFARRIEEAGIDEVKLKLREAIGESWQNTGKRLLLEMEKSDKIVLFIIDEFPQLIDNVCRAQGDEVGKPLLAWFRSVRMQQKDKLRRFRFIVGGSTSIDMILRRLDVPDKLNDFARLPVEALARDDAERLLQGLAKTYELNFTADALDSIFELIGPPVPYFLHLLVSQIILDPSLKGKPLSREDIEAVYHKRVIGPSCRSYFDYYRQRLKRYGKPGERAAIAILREIAAAPAGRVSDSALFAVYRKARKKGATDVEFLEIMADLECDWYVALDTATNEYRFLLDIMKAWWNRFYRAITTKRR